MMAAFRTVESINFLDFV